MELNLVPLSTREVGYKAISEFYKKILLKNGQFKIRCLECEGDKLNLDRRRFADVDTLKGYTTLICKDCGTSHVMEFDFQSVSVKCLGEGAIL